MDAPATPPDPLDRKALDRALRLLTTRYPAVLILVTEGDGLGNNNASAQAGNQNAIQGLIQEFIRDDSYSFEYAEEEESFGGDETA